MNINNKDPKHSDAFRLQEEAQNENPIRNLRHETNNIVSRNNNIDAFGK